MLKDIIFNLKGQYFDDIKAGLKTEEYRIYKDFWKKRLEGKEYRNIIIKKGYPSKDDISKIIIIPWSGYLIKEITHPEFGDSPVKVFAIQLDKKTDL